MFALPPDLHALINGATRQSHCMKGLPKWLRDIFAGTEIPTITDKRLIQFRLYPHVHENFGA
jgi:hypothetical protein